MSVISQNTVIPARQAGPGEWRRRVRPDFHVYTPMRLDALWLLGSRKALAAWRSRAVVWSVLNKKDNINAAYNQSSDTSTRHVYRPRGGDGSQVPGDRSC